MRTKPLVFFIILMHWTPFILSSDKRPYMDMDDDSEFLADEAACKEEVLLESVPKHEETAKAEPYITCEIKFKSDSNVSDITGIYFIRSLKQYALELDDEAPKEEIDDVSYIKIKRCYYIPDKLLRINCPDIDTNEIKEKLVVTLKKLKKLTELATISEEEDDEET